MARIAFARPRPRCRQLQSGRCHLKFVTARPARQILDRSAVAVAGRKIHRGEIRSVAQADINQRNLFEKLRPVEFRDDAHAGDDIAHGDIRRALPLQRMGDHIVNLRVLLSQAVLQPAMQWRLSGVKAAQPAGNLGGKNLGQRGFIIGSNGDM